MGVTRGLLIDIWRDLVHAGRSLAKARAFTFVCVVTLGIGMAPVIAIQCYARVFTTPPPSVNTEGLVELVTTRVGPHQATDVWSYPDFIDLGDATTGVSMTGWAMGESDVILPASGEQKRALPTMFVSSSYFRTIGVALASSSDSSSRPFLFASGAGSPSATSSRWPTSPAPRLRSSPRFSPASPLLAAPRRSSRWWLCDRHRSG
jgi:hypothetical protein